MDVLLVHFVRVRSRQSKISKKINPYDSYASELAHNIKSSLRLASGTSHDRPD